MGRGLEIKELSPLTIPNIESSFHDQSVTIPPAKLAIFGNYERILLYLASLQWMILLDYQ
jgi:hypothetical protein